MNFLKRLFTRPGISWIIVNVEDDGSLSLQTNMEKKKILKNCLCDGPREFQLEWIGVDEIVLRWVAGCSGHPYQIKVDATGIDRSFFDKSEPISVSLRSANKLLPKDQCKMIMCGRPDSEYFKQWEIAPDKVDNTYERYRIPFYLDTIKMAIFQGAFGKRKMAPTGTFFVSFPGTTDSKKLFKRLLAAYIKLPDTWDIVLGDNNFDPKIVDEQTS